MSREARERGKETSPRPLFTFWKSFIWSQRVQYILTAFNLAYNEKKLPKTLENWSRDMLNFNFFKKGLGIVFPQGFMYDCSRKMFLMIYSINWLKFIIWLSLLLEILGNMCIAIVFSRLWCHNFEINLICLIKPFFYKTKKLRQKCK